MCMRIFLQKFLGVVTCSALFVFGSTMPANAASLELIELPRGDWLMSVSGNPGVTWDAQTQTWATGAQMSTLWDQSISPDREQFCGKSILFNDGVRCLNTNSQNPARSIRGIQSTSPVLAVAVHNDVIVAGLEDYSIQVWDPALRQWQEQVPPRNTVPGYNLSVSIYDSVHCSTYNKTIQQNLYEQIIECYEIGQVGAAPFFRTTFTNALSGLAALKMVGPDTILVESPETFVYPNATQRLHRINIRNGSDHSLVISDNPLYFTLAQSADGEVVAWKEVVNNALGTSFVIKSWRHGQASATTVATYSEGIAVGFSRQNTKLWAAPLDGVWDPNTPGVPAGWNGPIQIQ